MAFTFRLVLSGLYLYDLYFPICISRLYLSDLCLPMCIPRIVFGSDVSISWFVFPPSYIFRCVFFRFVFSDLYFPTCISLFVFFRLVCFRFVLSDLYSPIYIFRFLVYKLYFPMCIPRLVFFRLVFPDVHFPFVYFVMCNF